MSTYLYERPRSEHGRSFDLDQSHRKSPLMRPRESRVGKCTKAWTLEEERILLQSRMDRIPYKHIATRLGKTDLACRLHYHQMVMAKRGPEMQPGRSIVFLSSEHPPEVHRLAPSVTVNTHPGHSHPRSTDLSGLGNGYLATPRPEAYHQRSSSYPQHSPGYSHQETPVFSLTPPRSYHRDRKESRSIDMGRLNDLYREHASEFWNSIATAYSHQNQHQLAPTDLESAFFSAAGNKRESELGMIRNGYMLPPPHLPSPFTSAGSTPSPENRSRSSASPEWNDRDTSSPPQSIQPGTTSTSKCSVESLLNRPAPSSVV